MFHQLGNERVPNLQIIGKKERKKKTETFKSAVAVELVIIENVNFQFQFQVRRGDSIRSKEQCSKRSVPNAAKLLRCLSSPRWASRSTVRHASRNACLTGEKVQTQASILTRNKHGHDEQTNDQEMVAFIQT